MMLKNSSIQQLQLFIPSKREDMRSGAGVKGQIYATNQCLPRHTFNETPTHPITHNYISHTRIREQTLSNTPRPIASTPLLLPPDGSSTPPLAPPHRTSWFVLISVYCLITSPNFGFRNFDGFGLYFGYQSVNNGMGFVDLVWILLLLLFL